MEIIQFNLSVYGSGNRSQRKGLAQGYSAAGKQDRTRPPPCSVPTLESTDGQVAFWSMHLSPAKDYGLPKGRTVFCLLVFPPRYT